MKPLLSLSKTWKAAIKSSSVVPAGPSSVKCVETNSRNSNSVSSPDPAWIKQQIAYQFPLYLHTWPSSRSCQSIKKVTLFLVPVWLQRWNKSNTSSSGTSMAKVFSMAWSSETESCPSLFRSNILKATRNSVERKNTLWNQHNNINIIIFNTFKIYDGTHEDTLIHIYHIKPGS